jgi:hypothetical protein
VEPNISILSPSPGQSIPQTSNTVRVEGIIVADDDWFAEHGLPNWEKQQKQKKQRRGKRSEEAAAVVEAPAIDPQVVEAKSISVSIDGFPVTAWLGPRHSLHHAGFFAEVSGMGLTPGAHTLRVNANLGAGFHLVQSFEIDLLIQATSIPTIRMGPGREAVPEGIPGHIEPSDLTPARIREVHRRLPRRKRPKAAEEREIIERLRERLRKLQTRFGGRDWVVIPPTPPISDDWRIVPRETLERWNRLRSAHREWREARERWQDDPTDENFREHNRTKGLYEFYRDSFQDELDCCCGCFVCLRIIRLTHPQMPRVPTAAEIRSEVAKAGSILAQCCIGLDFDIKELAITDEEHAGWLNTPQLPLLDREAFFRRINRRTTDVLSGKCVNVLYADPRGGSFGPNSHINSGIGGYVAGTDGLLELPDATNGPVPSHVLMTSDPSGRLLAHELAHVLCLTDGYGKLDDLFPQPTNLPLKERATRAYVAARAWRDDKKKEIADLQQANPGLSEKDARSRVFNDLSFSDKQRWLRVFNLMALENHLNCSDCEKMCRCIKRNFPGFCS